MNEGLQSLVFVGVMVGFFYLMLIRPQKRQKEAHRRLVESIGVGDEIVTLSGMYGTVRAVGDDTVDIEVSPGTTVRIVKQAVGRRIDPEHSEGEETA